MKAVNEVHKRRRRNTHRTPLQNTGILKEILGGSDKSTKRSTQSSPRRNTHNKHTQYTQYTDYTHNKHKTYNT